MIIIHTKHVSAMVEMLMIRDGDLECSGYTYEDACAFIDSLAVAWP